MDASVWNTGVYMPEKGGLFDLVKPLPPHVKKAFYAAANKGTIRKGTWNNCAFNAGGLQLENKPQIASHMEAARAFDIPVTLVTNFISVWDKLPGNDSQSTEELKEVIQKVGLFTTPEEVKAMETEAEMTQEPVKVVVFKSQMEQFEKEMATDTVAFSREAELLFAGA